MKNLSFISLVLMIFTLSSCSSIKITYDYNKDADFGKYKTFEIKKPDQIPSNYPPVLNPINQKRVENAIEEQMTLHNYKTSGTPDLFISYYLKVEDKVSYQTTTTPMYGYGSPYYRPGYYGYYYGYGHSWTETTATRYKEGTLIIDIVDAKTNQLVWYGAATKALSENQKDPEKVIYQAVSMIFDKYRYLAGQAAPIK